jgi:hypothetical protein
MGWSHNGAKAGNKLETLEGDANGDLTVTVGEAYAYAAQHVSEELAKYNYTQDMKAYPSDSGLKLISRAAAATADETPKQTHYVTGTLNLSKACIAPGKTLQLTCPGTDAHWAHPSRPWRVLTRNRSCDRRQLQLFDHPKDQRQL